MMSVSVLQALKDRNHSLAREGIQKGGDIFERDDYGNVPLHYAAGLGYMDLIEELLRLGTPVDIVNYHKQTPLIMAMEYNQLEAAKLLWSHQRAKIRTDESPYAMFIVELCTIGVDRTRPINMASSGFFRENSPLKHKHHPEMREIGQKLYDLGGRPAMVEVFEGVYNILGPAADELRAGWDGIGEWMF